MPARRSFGITAVLVTALAAAGCASVAPTAPPPAASSTAPSGAPTVTVEPVAPTAVVGQPVSVTVHGSDVVGVARIDLRVADVTVAAATSPSPAGQPSLDATLTWTPTTAGAVALVAIAYRADGTASAPSVSAIQVVDAAGSAPPTILLTPGAPGFPASAEPSGSVPVETSVPGETSVPTMVVTPPPTRRPTAPPTPTPAPLPDLVVGSLDVYDSTGTEKAVVAFIQNKGRSPAGAFNVSMSWSASNGGGASSPQQVPSLNPGDGYQVQFETTSLDPGAYTFVVTADSDKLIAESNEDNNTRTKKYTVVAAPTPTPTAPPAYDLYIIGPTFPSSMTVGQEASGAFYIANAGPDAIPQSFSYSWGYSGPNGGGVSSGQIDGLAAGDKQFVSMKLTPDTAGDYHFTVTVDSGDDVAETNEANNQVTFTVTATSP